MNILLDTHVILWWLTDDQALSDETKTLIDSQADIYISAATIWEVTIKQALGKIAGPPDLAERIRDGGFSELAIRSEHAIVAGRLPDIHRDPFDRMIVAQAQCERLVVATRDPYIQKYEVEVLAV